MWFGVVWWCAAIYTVIAIQYKAMQISNTNYTIYYCHKVMHCQRNSMAVPCQVHALLYISVTISLLRYSNTITTSPVLCNLLWQDFSTLSACTQLSYTIAITVMYDTMSAIVYIWVIDIESTSFIDVFIEANYIVHIVWTVNEWIFIIWKTSLIS